MSALVQPQATQQASVLKITALQKQFGDLQVLKGIDLKIRKGEVVGLIGASGSGKSTLLRCINRLETPTSGSIEFNGSEITEANLNTMRRNIGMVFQRFHLFPHLTAVQNVSLAPTRVLKTDLHKAQREAIELLDQVKLADKANAFPAELSGGQQQRVAIARALALQPELLLFDEPTSALDPELVGEVLDVMSELAKLGKTMLVATHEMGFCREAANRVIFLDGGVIIEEGEPAAVLGAPTQARTREFLARVLRANAV